MILNQNSFPKLQIILIFFLLSLFSCSEKTTNTLDNEKFIEIYARFLIIYEMEVSKEYHDRLIGELFREFDTTIEQVDSTLAYLNRNPEKWVTTLDGVRNRIQEIRKELVPQEEIPIEVRNKWRSEPGKATRNKSQEKPTIDQRNRKREEKIKARSKKQEIRDKE